MGVSDRHGIADEKLGGYWMIRMNEQLRRWRKSAKRTAWTTAHPQDAGRISAFLKSMCHSQRKLLITMPPRARLHRPQTPAVRRRNSQSGQRQSERDSGREETLFGAKPLPSEQADIVYGCWGKANTREHLPMFTDSSSARGWWMRYRYMEGMSAKRQKLYSRWPEAVDIW
jgi:hypothetical protein